MKDLKTAQKSLWLQLPILSLMSLSTSFSGLTIYAKYHLCDPVKSGGIAINDQVGTNIQRTHSMIHTTAYACFKFQLMPFFVVDTMGNVPGLTGLFIAGLYSAALSTVSATINSLAAVTIEDYYKVIQIIDY